MRKLTKLAQMDAWRNTVKLHVFVAQVDTNGTFANAARSDLDSGSRARGVTSLDGLVLVQ